MIRRSARWTETPDVPAGRLEPVAEDDAVLVWVRHGVGTVRTDDEVLVAREGEAVWIPPGLRHSAELAPGSVAVPVITEVEAVPDVLRSACVVPVPAGWEDWLVYRMARGLGLTSAADPDRTHLLDLLVGMAPPAPAADRPVLPPLPRSPEARSVVERLRRHPAADASLAELAADVLVSPRTLQRRLVRETGLGLGQWRTAIRLDVAASHLARGRDLGWTAHHVGYASVSGFAHAFAAYVGTSPGRYASAHRGEPAATVEPPAELAVLVGRAEVAPTPPPVPASPPTTWVRPFDCLLWVYRGGVTVTVDGRTKELVEDDLVWLPHGVAHEVEVSAGSILLPLGWLPAGRPVRGDDLEVLRVPPDPRARRFAMHLVVANHFLLRPPGHDEHAFVGRLRPPATEVPESLPEHLAEVVAAVVADPADARSLADWAERLGADVGALRREFVAVMGESFPRWRAKVRMTEARMILWDGHPPTVAARRLGYAHLPAFTKAFTAAHGMPPTEWLRRDAG